ncbi:MAG: glycosyltransferase family 39 protein [Chloroflexota bacterium]|nr:glycosyltransferase family 39 protein [Chloroflexota bacterium]
MAGRDNVRLHVNRWERWALVGLFLLAFVPRAVYPVSRPLQWYFRSAQFFQAVLHGDWAGTLFSEHPGVTVMWLSGAALWGWYALQSLLGLNPPTPLETEGYAFADRVAVGILPLALLVALGILWGWVLLRRLFGQRVAWVAALLWALDPFYLANSKALHLDALLSTLMLLSVLWILIYLREGHLWHLVISAALGGLAILTKVTALFLIPFLGLCLLIDFLLSLRNRQSIIHSSRCAIHCFLLWFLVAIAVCLLFWPSMWVHPGRTLDVVIRQGIILHVDKAHSLPRFHRGELMMGDPGTLFYVDVLLFRMTFLTVPFCIVGLGVALAQRRDNLLPALLLGAFAFFYFAQMTLGSRKEGRYMLPVLLALDVLSAYGMVWYVNRVRASTALRLRYAIPLALAVQAFLVLPCFPYFGTHYNNLPGGTGAAVRVLPPADFGEGLDIAGRYVDGQPGAEGFGVATQFLANEMLAQYVRAPVYDIAQVGDDVDYLVFGVQYTLRGREHPRWGALWEQTYKFREPEFGASFGGVPYAWVHRPGAGPVIPNRLDARLGEAVRLVGYRLAQDKAVPGDTLLLTLYWQAEEPVEGGYTVFVHLQGPDGRLVAQQDTPPARATRPTGGWEIGVLVEDPYELALPPDVSSGDYRLSVGMYDPATLERLAAFGADTGRLPEDRVALATVQVRPAVPWWRWALSGAWLVIIAAGIVYPWVRRRE